MSFNETEFVPSFKVTSSTSSQRNEICRFELLIMAQREFPIKAACQTYLLMLYDSKKPFIFFLYGIEDSTMKFVMHSIVWNGKIVNVFMHNGH